MSDVFQDQVALVTGAASGIGKACVEAFLARGAIAVGLDINPRIVDLFDRPDYFGVVCDIGDERNIIQAIQTVAQKFGRLDMLALNAGIFPASCPIEKISLADWHKTMRINLDANVILLRECYPWLKVAPQGGRVVVNGSRNVPAPGPGAAAYSASKAALTQVARIAALEWGKDGIRVNIVHPDAVFDTGIWTDEVLQARAKNYGMTVEQYKKRNVMQVEITSHNVAAMIVEMCGPVFAKTTGAQVSIDGGNDRVI